MTFSKRTSSSSSVSSESTHEYGNPSDDFFIRIPEPISDGTTGPTNVHELSYSYAALRLDNHSASEVENFFQNQTIILVPAPQPKFRINWTAVCITLVACVIGGIIGWGIAYGLDNGTSHRLKSKALVNIPSIDMEPVLSKINFPKMDEIPSLKEMAKEAEEADELQKRLPDIIKSSERLLPKTDDILLYRKRILEEEEEARNKLKEQVKSVLKLIQQRPPQNRNCTSNCELPTFITRLTPIKFNNTSDFAKLSN